MTHVEITTEDIPSVLDRDLKTGNKKPPVFLAWYGLGKSMQAALWATKMMAHYIDYRGAYKTFNDVRGFGIPNHEEERMKFYHDEDLDFKEGVMNVLHLEEIGLLSPQTQKVMMQMLLEKRVGKFFFPEDTFVMGSSNMLAHKTGVEPWLAALADRVGFYRIRPDFDSYQRYLMDHGKTPYLLAFLNSNPSAPYDFKIKEWDRESNLPTFRSFSRLDELTDSYDDIAEAVADPLFRAHATARVGPKYGQMYTEFIKLTSRVSDVESMIEDADRCSIPHEVDIKWLIACRSIALADKNNVDKVLTLAHRLTDPNMNNPQQLDMLESFVGNSISRIKKDLLKTQALVGWRVKHADELSGKVN